MCESSLIICNMQRSHRCYHVVNVVKNISIFLISGFQYKTNPQPSICRQPHRDAVAFSQCMLTGLLIAFKFHPPQGVYSDQQGQQRAVWTFRAGKGFKTCFQSHFTGSSDDSLNERKEKKKKTDGGYCWVQMQDWVDLCLYVEADVQCKLQMSL